MMIIRWIVALFLAFLLGRLITKIHMPAILGWLIGGMLLGPHALHLMPQSLIDSAWYTAAQDVLSVVVGLMLGTELIADKLKKYGRALHLRLYRGAGSRQIFWRAWRCQSDAST
jgi:Kef-type K+ transport system membrane component KefB